MLVVHRSNRMEALVELLARELALPLGNPMLPETLLIQSRGMQRWLSMVLSERLGVWANASFPFPRSFFDTLLGRLEGDSQDGPSPYAREQLTWTIATELEEFRADPRFGVVAAYLGSSTDPARRLELGGKIARVFDQYVVYRPDVIEAWETGEGNDWQAALWRQIVRRHGNGHFAARARRALASSGAPPTLGGEWLPERISVVGISSLPPIYVALLGWLARVLDVHCYLLSPCREYWAYARSPRQLGRLEPRGGGLDPLEHWELGNALLGGLGRQGREFLQVLETTLEPGREDDAYVEPGEACCLHIIQGDVLALRSRGHEGDAPRVPMRSGDRSIQVHSCHSTLRQLEALKDVLLEEFRLDCSLMPHDVIVMAPDIDRAAPLIDAVFGESGEGEEPIPYRVADRPLRGGAEFATAFIELLRVLGGRLKASEVLELLQHRPIRQLFAISEESLASLSAWVARAGVRWARDAVHRGEHGVPELDTHTWKYGLSRLLLGVAMPARLIEPFAGVLPCEGAEGSNSELLGAFAGFADALIDAQRRLPNQAPMPEWSALLLGYIEAFTQTDEYAAEAGAVRGVLRDLALEAERGGMLEPLPLRYVLSEIEARLTAETNGHQFMAGGVTFCAMLPMRSVPFRVVCLIDMDDGVFPRAESPPSFDLIASEPRVGDRSLREEDRYLFLEALLSARQVFAVFYSGRGLHDTQPRPPSGVVSELLDIVDASVSLESDGAAAELASTRLVVEHPLMPYSPLYFTDGGDARLFSYSSVYADASARLIAERRPYPEPFQRRELDEVQPLAEVRLEDLGRFLEHPIRVYAERELGVRLVESELLRLDREPLELDPLTRYSVGQALLDLTLEGRGVREAEELVRAAGLLPHRALGRFALERLWRDVEPIADAARRIRVSAEKSPIAIDVNLEEGRLVGIVHDMYQDRCVFVSFARTSARQRLRAWLAYLALAGSERQTVPPQTVLIARQSAQSGRKGGSIVTFGGVDRAQARRWLRDLCEIYSWGRRGPLPFFPDAAEAYASRLAAVKSGDVDARNQALDAARKVLRSARFAGSGDASDAAYVNRFFEGHDPVKPRLRFLVDSALEWPDFESLASRVFGPLVGNSSEQST